MNVLLEYITWVKHMVMKIFRILNYYYLYEKLSETLLFNTSKAQNDIFHI